MLQWPPEMSFRSVRGLVWSSGALSKPCSLSARSKGLTVTRQAAVIATPGSTRVQTMADVPVSRGEISKAFKVGKGNDEQSPSELLPNSTMYLRRTSVATLALQG